MPFQGNADTSDSTDQETMSKTNELNIRQIAKYKMESTGAITKSIMEISDTPKHI